MVAHVLSLGMTVLYRGEASFDALQRGPHLVTIFGFVTALPGSAGRCLLLFFDEAHSQSASITSAPHAGNKQLLRTSSLCPRAIGKPKRGSLPDELGLPSCLQNRPTRMSTSLRRSLRRVPKLTVTGSCGDTALVVRRSAKNGPVESKALISRGRVEEGRLTGTYWQPVVSLPRSSVGSRTDAKRSEGPAYPLLPVSFGSASLAGDPAGCRGKAGRNLAYSL